ncbi:hypothetical protein FUAX_37540 [Fulvitalea axinellae]|uniref:Uncharacterized protein n=2 Tax=Fulvitalea axinellae TaxID=1182444 RepID=A0AAU9CTJ7_9BACT|nr:hypothetical protein FUAX_37540 [Fulvitalea axinellae]
MFLPPKKRAFRQNQSPTHQSTQTETIQALFTKEKLEETVRSKIAKQYRREERFILLGETGATESEDASVKQTDSMNRQCEKIMRTRLFLEFAKLLDQYHHLEKEVASVPPPESATKAMQAFDKALENYEQLQLNLARCKAIALHPEQFRGLKLPKEHFEIAIKSLAIVQPQPLSEEQIETLQELLEPETIEFAKFGYEALKKIGWMRRVALLDKVGAKLRQEKEELLSKNLPLSKFKKKVAEIDQQIDIEESQIPVFRKLRALRFCSRNPQSDTLQPELRRLIHDALIEKYIGENPETEETSLEQKISKLTEAQQNAVNKAEETLRTKSRELRTAMGMKVATACDEDGNPLMEGKSAVYHSFDARKMEMLHHAQMEILDILEHYIYQWMRANPIEDRREAMTATLIDFLDDIQEEHYNVVAKMTKFALPIWTPDLSRMSKRQFENLQGFWGELVEGKTHINYGTSFAQIPPSVARECRGVYNAMYARLLSRPEGRKLLHSTAYGHLTETHLDRAGVPQTYRSPNFVILDPKTEGLCDLSIDVRCDASYTPHVKTPPVWLDSDRWLMEHKKEKKLFGSTWDKHAVPVLNPAFVQFGCALSQAHDHQRMGPLSGLGPAKGLLKTGQEERFRPRSLEKFSRKRNLPVCPATAKMFYQIEAGNKLRAEHGLPTVDGEKPLAEAPFWKED